MLNASEQRGLRTCRTSELLATTTKTTDHRTASVERQLFGLCVLASFDHVFNVVLCLLVGLGNPVKMKIALLAVLVLAHATQPVYISDYLDTPDQGQKATKVSGIGNSTSYNGYATVNVEDNSNIFFWFFPAQNGNQSAPILMWLQGGPGGSSMFGLFSENGPFYVSADSNSTLEAREWTWNRNYHMLYVDNPVGTGFSFTDSESGYSTAYWQAAENLYSAITQFFTVFYQYQKNDFYVCGESYGGKWGPSFAYKIHQENNAKNPPKVPINLVGISVGDGLMDPSTQFVGFGELLYSFGLADEYQLNVINQYEASFVEYLNAGNLAQAFYVFDEFLNGDFWPYGTYFFNITGTNEYFNFLDPIYPPNNYPAFLNSPATRELMHVGDNAYWDYNHTVEFHLIGDWMRGIKPQVEVLLDNYKVLIYSGQNDLILGASLTENFVNTLQWSGSNQYATAHRQIWYPPGETAIPSGYVKQAGAFTRVVVRDAGHLLPEDQPYWAYLMISNFVDGTPF
jgi:vitellogenic carboxypeptidase-like protein